MAKIWTPAMGLIGFDMDRSVFVVIFMMAMVDYALSKKTNHQSFWICALVAAVAQAPAHIVTEIAWLQFTVHLLTDCQSFFSMPPVVEGVFAEMQKIGCFFLILFSAKTDAIANL